MNKKKNISADQAPDKAYFDSLTDRIMERIELEESILYRNSRLKTLPFRTPEGYFEQLGNDLFKIDQKEAKVIPLWSQNWVRYAAAAVILIFSVLFVTKPFEATTPQSYLGEIPEEVLIEYVAQEETAIDELFINEEVMNAVLDEMMADIAYTYEDLIDFEKDGLYLDNY